jgi:Uma2 family endonuclease
MVLAKTFEKVKELITAEDLWQMGSRAENYELVRGKLIEMAPPGGEHGDIASEIIVLLRSFAKQHKLGKVLIETGFILNITPSTVRSPDISFLAAGKIPSEGLPRGFIPGAPDLAVEVVSPGDAASGIQDKVQDYLAYGTSLIWVVYPQQRIVIVHYPDGTARTLREADTLSGETIIPGFSCQVAEIVG